MLREGWILATAVLAFVAARIFPLVVPSTPPSGLALGAEPEIAILGGGLYHHSPRFVASMVKVVEWTIYPVIAVVALSSLFGRGFGRMTAGDAYDGRLEGNKVRNGYVIFSILLGVPLFLVLLVLVFGITLFDTVILAPIFPPNTESNFGVLSAPIFLVTLVVGTVTARLSRQIELNEER